jgi:DNA-binding NarL/FixJ family response regulator
LFLGDDHTLVRQGLRKILEEKGEWEVVADAGVGREAVRQMLALRPDVVLLDIGMPLLNGIESTRQIVRRHPEIRVLILSMHADEPYIIKALQAGAKGYLLKDSADTDLIRGVADVAAGKSFFSPAVAKVMLDDYVRHLADKGISDRYDALSEREREIFQLIARTQQQGHRRGAVDQSGHCGNAPRPHLPEARSPQHRRSRPLRGPARHHFFLSAPEQASRATAARRTRG